MPIRQLSVQLANQIAAGEVVERPASVVKELLENAVDAGAQKIVLEVEAAGRQAVVVRDDGAGIPRAELALALAPHATSKIACVEDLDAITTLGFRGEALASIASVSKLTLTSKPAAQETAFAVHTEGPAMDPVIVPAAHPNGTSVEVRELFFNTPARRRFLRSDRTEMARIKDVWLRTALAHGEIAFELYQDGKLMQALPPAAADDAAAQRRRFGKLISGQFVREAVDLNISAPGLELNGLLLPPPPEYASVPENIYLFLNGRPLADKLLTHALREAYREVNGSRASVRALLFLRCDPHAVDVNVHPRKDEVRFHEARMVHDCLVDAVVSTLHGTVMPERNRQTTPPPPAFSEAEIAAFNNETLDEAAAARAFAAQGGSQTFEDLVAQLKRPLPTPPKPAVPAVLPPLAAAWETPAVAAEKNGAGASVPLGMTSCAADNQPASANAVSPSLLPEDRPVVLAADDTQVAIATVAPAPQEVSSLDAASAQAQVLGAQLIDMPLPGVWLLKLQGRYFLVRAARLQQESKAAAIIKQLALGKLPAAPLALPLTLRVEASLVKALKLCAPAVERMGFTLKLKRESIDLLAVPAELKGSELAGKAVRALHLTAAAGKSLAKGQCPQQLALLLAQAAAQPVLLNPREASLLLQTWTDADKLAALDGVSELLIGQWARELLGVL